MSSSSAGDLLHGLMSEATGGFSRRSLSSESRTLIGKLQPPCRLPLDEARATVRRLAILSGTDVEENDDDPFGDGDQSLVGVKDDHDASDPAKVMEGEPTRQILRDLFAAGGDMEPHLVTKGGLSPFARMCALGRAAAVKRALDDAPEGSEERARLLERRETGMRLTPLLLAVALSKCKPYVCQVTGAREADMDHAKTVRVLLRYGARPDCKEITGKTIVHCGAGSHASEESLKMADYAIEAAKSSAHFGEKVILRKLNNDEYNGLMVTLGGFLAESRRRQVLLDEGEKQLALLPKNIFSIRESGEEVSIYDESRKLVNDFDRCGTISMHEVFMSTRTDVAEFLIHRGVSVDIAPACGNTIRKMALAPTLPFGRSTTSDLIRKYITKMEKVES